MKIYGKGCCLVKINMHMASNGIYFVVWNIQVIDLKRRNCAWTKDKHEKQMPPSPISLQRYKICMSSMLSGSLKLWNAINQVLFELLLQERFSKSSISTISAIVRWLASLVNYQFSWDQSETTPIFQKEYKYIQIRHTYYVRRDMKKAHWKAHWRSWTNGGRIG